MHVSNLITNRFLPMILASAVFTGCSAPTGKRVRPGHDHDAREGWAGRVWTLRACGELAAPLADGPDGVSHDGWTWVSVGAVHTANLRSTTRARVEPQSVLVQT